jgi:hypothetical protein
MLYQSKYMYTFSHSCCSITYALNFHIASCKCCSSMHTLDHVALALDEPTEQAQVEAITNIVWIKASPVYPTNIS